MQVPRKLCYVHTRNLQAPNGASFTVQLPKHEIFLWGRFRTVTIVPVTFKIRRGSGWWLVVHNCPFCGQKHMHGSNLDADWQATDASNPLRYAEQAKYSHCEDMDTRGLYQHEITAGLPSGVR